MRSQSVGKVSQAGTSAHKTSSGRTVSCRSSFSRGPASCGEAGRWRRRTYGARRAHTRGQVPRGGARDERLADWSYQARRFCGGAAVSGYHPHPPELVPILSRGKHRSPRKGACFMELASYLAGERWSDHPDCTHPLLAAAAREVNDYTSDAGRSRLAELIPSVIGLTGDDLHLDARIALRCARTALPVVAAERQQTMAVSVLACERVLAGLDGRRRLAGGPEPAGAGASSACCAVGPHLHPRHPDLAGGLSPGLRARYGPRRGGGDRASMRPAARRDAP